MQFLEANGARLHYQLDGAAGLPVLMLSNSLGANLAMWDLQVPALVRHFRVLRYDTRGLGASEVTPGPYTMEQLGRDVIGLLDALAIERVRFCGLSMGAMIGMWLGRTPRNAWKNWRSAIQRHVLVRPRPGIAGSQPSARTAWRPSSTPPWHAGSGPKRWSSIPSVWRLSGKCCARPQ